MSTDRRPQTDGQTENAWNARVQNTPFMLNYCHNPDTATIVFLLERNLEVNKLLVGGQKQLALAKLCLQVVQRLTGRI
jgi:hypothetical protein